MPILGIIASSLRKAFTDTFNRTTSGSLGTSSGGGVWVALRGIWFANGTKGTSTDAANTYPIAGYNLGTANATVNLDVDTAGGTGIAFWVTDSANWWGIFPFTATNTTYSQACSAYAQTGPGYSCGAYGSGSACNAYGAGPYTVDCIAYDYTYAYVFCGAFARGGGGTVCTGYTATTVCTSSLGPFYGSACSAYTSASATSAGTKTLRLLKSVANTITTVVDQTIASLPASLQLITSGTSITGRAYTNAGQSVQIGTDLVTTQTAGGTRHGLILAPGGYTQGTTVDNLTIKL
jgi:hypothetical protein